MKDLKKYYHIPAPAEDVYAAITNPVTLQLWTGEPAIMSTDPGSEFSLWDGSIVGKTIECIPGKKLTQQWYFGEQPLDSIVTIILHPKGMGTSVELTHTNIPDEDFEDVAEGWNNSYFGTLREFYRD